MDTLHKRLAYARYGVLEAFVNLIIRELETPLFETESTSGEIELDVEPFSALHELRQDFLAKLLAATAHYAFCRRVVQF